MTLAELLALSIAEMTDDELAAHLLAIQEAAAAEAEDADDETLEVLEQAAARATEIRSLQETRDQEAEAAAERAAAAIATINGEAAAGDEGEAAEGEEGDAGDGDAEGDEGASDEGASTEGDADGAATGDGEGDATEGEEEQPTAIAASGRAPRISKVNARRPAGTQPRVPAGTQRRTEFSLTAAANVSGIEYGRKLRTADDVAAVLMAGIESAAGYNGPATKVPLARARVSFPDQFHLSSEDPNGNARKLRKVREGVRQHGNRTALAAAGGSCAPFDIWYDQPTAGTDARPVRDRMLNRVGADRGGVTIMPTPRLPDVEGAVDFWDDEAGHVIGDAEATTKTIVEVDCEGPVDVDTYTVTKRIRFKNYRARYFRENVEAILELIDVAHARKAETRLLQLFGAACVQTSSGQVLGTSRDVLTTLDRAVAGYRSRYRIDQLTPLAFAFPFWLYDQIRADLTREMPGSSDERLAMADAKIDAFFRARMVNPIPFLDGESGQVFGPQGAGPITGWPSTVVTYLYVDGDAHFLDGGGLDLGVVRDSSLNEVNKYELFSETVEGFFYHGATDPLRIVMDTVPDGSTSAAVDLSALSASGS